MDHVVVILIELGRRPGGALVASDGYDNEGTRLRHADDRFVPLVLTTLPDRLGAFGFTDVGIDRGEYDFRFHARKPAQDGS